MEEVGETKYLKKPTCRERYLYFLKLLENVLLTGVPQIVLEKNFRRKFFKLTVLFVCLVGFFYQFATFLLLYFDYPTTLQVLVKFMDSDNLPQPLITVCGMNGIRRTAYCSDFPEECIKPENISEFCLDYPYFCDKDNFTEGDLMFPDSASYQYGDRYRHKVEKYGTRPEDILYHHRNFTKHIIYENELYRLRNCYYIDLNSINGVLDYPYQYLTMFHENVISNIMLNFHPEESFRPNVPIGAKISVHAKQQLINPFVDGFLVTPGKRYVVQLKAIEEDLLPSPYSTNCSHYEYLESKVSTREKCIVECQKEICLEKCGCVSGTYPYEFHGRFCESEREFLCYNDLDADVCHDKCRRNCKSHLFEYEIDESPIEIMDLEEITSLTSKAKFNYRRQRMSVLNFFFKRPEIVVFKYKPEYEIVKVFGYVGGLVGMWLGISFIAVFDFLETLVNYIYHMIKGKVPGVEERSSGRSKTSV